MRSDVVQSKSLLLIMENCLPFTDYVMVVLVHKCAQQTHLLALHLETLGYIPRLLNALSGLVYFLIIGDPRGNNLMVGSISRKLLTELGIRTEDAECKLMGDKFYFVIFVLFIKSCVDKYTLQWQLSRWNYQGSWNEGFNLGDAFSKSFSI